MFFFERNACDSISANVRSVYLYIDVVYKFLSSEFFVCLNWMEGLNMKYVEIRLMIKNLMKNEL